MKDDEIKGKEWDFVSIANMNSEEDYFTHHLRKYCLVRDIIVEESPKTILDIGVGTGIFYSLLPDFSKYEVHGIEFVSNFIPLLQKRGIRTHQCNIEKDPIPHVDATFDLVICDSIIEHTLKPKHLISEIYRVLKPGGSFILVAPNATSFIRRWGHFRGRNLFEPLINNLYTKDYLARCSVFYSEKELRFVLENNSLSIKRVDYINETSHDARSLAVSIARFLGLFVPKFRDVIFVTGIKK